jgi:hypothetical protein
MEALAINRRKRGEITQVDIAPFLSISTHELHGHLNSPIPIVRTCAATVFGNHKTPEAVSYLCQRLKVEKKLYCKIAISDALVKIGSFSVKPLLALLGKVGSNQETEIPRKGFNKKSYPLPRDIAARTLCRIGGDILPEIFEFIKQTKQPIEIEQAIDVIGHIVYTNKLSIDSKILIQIADKFSEFPMVQFKIARCFSGFTDNQAKRFLYMQLQSSEIGLQFEAVRSLVLSGLDFPVDSCELPEKVVAFIR